MTARQQLARLLPLALLVVLAIVGLRVVSIIAVAAGTLRLALSGVPPPAEEFFATPAARTWLTFLAALPWEEIAVAALLWLEVQHPARPWHTAALGFGLGAYLLAVHIGESGAPAGRLLRRQAKVLLAGACLLALGAGFAMLPAACLARAPPCSGCWPPWRSWRPPR